ncbi:MAG: hypothetical protein IJT94_17995, partial [Oscillibacter sp.]|nr:hypothetical protein [Oscillibacter sp.]
MRKAMSSGKWVLLTACALVMAFAAMACASVPYVDVEASIKAAEKMSLAELEAAARAELEASPGTTFNADSLTSGVKKALAKFEKKYPWTAGRTAYNSKKGSEYQPKLSAAQKAGSYIADFVMLQDASFLKNAMLDTNFLL